MGARGGPRSIDVRSGRGVALVIVAACLAACGPGSRPDAVDTTDAAAREHMAAGEFTRAAEEYLRLAELYPKSAARHQLGAAEAYLAARQLADALATAQTAQPARRQSPEAARKQLLLAEIALLQQHPEDALTLSPPLPAAAPANLRLRRHDLRARAHAELGDLKQAVVEWVALLAAGPEPDLEQRAVRALWAGLSGLDVMALQEFIGSGNADLAAWSELAQLARLLRGRSDELEPAIDAWVATHPGHAAVPRITGEILTSSRLITGARDHVALLLPLTGQFARAAAAVRDGFLMRMYLQTELRPMITVLDTNAGNVADRYAEAVRAGAQFIVGPLEKEAVARLAEFPLLVPTLALNRSPAGGAGSQPDQTPDPMLFKFSLSPEDEATEAARRAFADGHRNALVVVPDNELGDRLAAAFTAAWHQHGGAILEQVKYRPEAADFAAVTRELFNLDSSQERAATLRQDIGVPVHASARKRRDADMIFMPLPPAEARQVMPHLRYFGADHVPAYATAAVYSGAPNPQLDHDIDSVRFPDIPWVVAPDSGAIDFRQAVDGALFTAAAGLRRLYAFGADAFQIMARINQLTGNPGATLPGESGELYLAAGGEFHRRLNWAIFRGGVPVALDSVPSP
ncbi:MAG: penicillin-binding protein activator [Gammaproteobacteria bacterium]|nr:penicillin-binding protein activator [Gammaproteobacteria bacterium]